MRTADRPVEPAAPVLDDAHRIVRERSRHAAAEHIAAITQPKPIARRVLLAAAGILAVGAGLWWFDQRATVAAADAVLATTEPRLTTRDGQRAAITLDDGSRVMVGAATSVKVIPEFGVLRRVIGIDGSAQVTIAPADKDLTIRAGELTIIADSGEVAVSAFPGEPAVVSVLQGSARVRAPADDRRIEAGETLISAGGGRLRAASAIDRSAALAWIEGNVVIDGRPLAEALPILRRWFGTRVSVADSSLLERIVTASAPLGSSRILIDGMAKSADLRLEWKDEEMILADGRARPR